MSGFCASVWFTRKLSWVWNVQPLLTSCNVHFHASHLPDPPSCFFQEGLEMRLNIGVAVPLTQNIKMPWITMANVVPVSMVSQPKYICSTATTITRIGAVDRPGLVRPIQLSLKQSGLQYLPPTLVHGGRGHTGHFLLAF